MLSIKSWNICSYRVKSDSQNLNCSHTMILLPKSMYLVFALFIFSICQTKGFNPGSPATLCDFANFNFYDQPNSLGVYQTYTSSFVNSTNITITAYGFTLIEGHKSVPVNLYGKIEPNEGEMGLGITTSSLGAHEISGNDFIQLNISQLVDQLDSVANYAEIKITSLQYGEFFGLYASRTLGELGSRFYYNGYLVDDVYVPIPDFGKYRFISVKAETFDVLLKSLRICAHSYLSTRPSPCPSIIPNSAPLYKPSVIPTLSPQFERDDLSHIPSYLPTANLDILEWHFTRFVGLLENCVSYSSIASDPTKSIEACGYKNDLPTALYGKNEEPNEHGLGIASTERTNEIIVGTFVQLNMSMLSGSNRLISFMMESVTGIESFAAYGSSTKGVMGTDLLYQGNLQLLLITLPIHTLDFTFVSITATNGDVLLSQVVAENITSTVPLVEPSAEPTVSISKSPSASIVPTVSISNAPSFLSTRTPSVSTPTIIPITISPLVTSTNIPSHLPTNSQSVPPLTHPPVIVHSISPLVVYTVAPTTANGDDSSACSADPEKYTTISFTNPLIMNMPSYTFFATNGDEYSVSVFGFYRADGSSTDVCGKLLVVNNVQEDGLGICYTQNNEISKKTFIQIDMSSLLLSSAIHSVDMRISSVQWNESFAIYGSNEFGVLGDDMLYRNGSLVDNRFFRLPSSYVNYKYISVTALWKNVLLSALRFCVVNSNSTLVPSVSPSSDSLSPTVFPTYAPSTIPSSLPSIQPIAPTYTPFITPSALPSIQPIFPTAAPSITPSSLPSIQPIAPTYTPFITPSSLPSIQPIFPTAAPSITPSFLPSIQPIAPTITPSITPSFLPSIQLIAPTVTPSITPSSLPSIQPIAPTVTPSITPSSLPSIQPIAPTVAPTGVPSFTPSSYSPTFSPTRKRRPTFIPTISSQPSFIPTYAPTEVSVAYQPGCSISPIISSLAIPSSHDVLSDMMNGVQTMATDDMAADTVAADCGSSSVRFRAYFKDTGLQTRTYFKTSCSADETGLGLNFTRHNEINKRSFIQIDFSILYQNPGISQDSALTIVSVQPGESFDLYGSNVRGQMGTDLLYSGDSSMSNIPIRPIPGFLTYNYISVTATAGDILIGSLGISCSGSLYDEIATPVPFISSAISLSSLFAKNKRVAAGVLAISVLLFVLICAFCIICLRRLFFNAKTTDTRSKSFDEWLTLGAVIDDGRYGEVETDREPMNLEVSGANPLVIVAEKRHAMYASTDDNDSSIDGSEQLTTESQASQVNSTNFYFDKQPYDDAASHSQFNNIKLALTSIKETLRSSKNSKSLIDSSSSIISLSSPSNHYEHTHSRRNNSKVLPNDVTAVSINCLEESVDQQKQSLEVVLDEDSVVSFNSPQRGGDPIFFNSVNPLTQNRSMSSRVDQRSSNCGKSDELEASVGRSNGFSSKVDSKRQSSVSMTLSSDSTESACNKNASLFLHSAKSCGQIVETL